MFGSTARHMSLATTATENVRAGPKMPLLKRWARERGEGRGEPWDILSQLEAEVPESPFQGAPTSQAEREAGAVACMEYRGRENSFTI